VSEVAMKIILSILALAYTLCPYDLFPDFIIGGGWLDDLIILYFLWRYFYAHKGKRYRYESFYQKSRQSYEGESGKGFSGNKSTDDGYRFREKDSAKDPYTVLGIGRDASREEIKRAYRRLASKYHPDKVIHLGEEFRKLAEKRFKEIQMAYQELKVK
jgi:uncharacterized membrane protein YkvA (DUF1232 family)